MRVSRIRCWAWAAQYGDDSSASAMHRSRWLPSMSINCAQSRRAVISSSRVFHAPTELLYQVAHVMESRQDFTRSIARHPRMNARMAPQAERDEVPYGIAAAVVDADDVMPVEFAVTIQTTETTGRIRMVHLAGVDLRPTFWAANRHGVQLFQEGDAIGAGTDHLPEIREDVILRPSREIDRHRRCTLRAASALSLVFNAATVGAERRSRARWLIVLGDGRTGMSVRCMAADTRARRTRLGSVA